MLKWLCLLVASLCCFWSFTIMNNGKMNKSPSKLFSLHCFITVGSLPRSSITFSNNMNTFIASNSYWWTALKKQCVKIYNCSRSRRIQPISLLTLWLEIWHTRKLIAVHQYACKLNKIWHFSKKYGHSIITNHEHVIISENLKGIIVSVKTGQWPKCQPSEIESGGPEISS